jgi:hypothetical protein
MTAPAIGNDGFYSVFVMWLDKVDMDAHLDPFEGRYCDNKRSKRVHSQGWEQQWACSLDQPCKMISSGNYQKLASHEKKSILARQQSWQLLARENNVPLPQSQPVARLKPGVVRKRSKKSGL